MFGRQELEYDTERLGCESVGEVRQRDHLQAGIHQDRRQPPGAGNAEVVEPVLEIGFLVTASHGVQACRTAFPLSHRCDDLVDAGPLFGPEPGVGDRRERSRVVERRFPKLAAAPLPGGRRVVELVRESRGQGSELGHALDLPQAVGVVPQPADEHVEHRP